MSNSKDNLIIPLSATVSIPWPFTKFGKSLDVTLNQNNFDLVRKEFKPYEPQNTIISLIRIYESLDNHAEIIYKHQIYGPSKTGGIFEPDEVTWIGDNPLMMINVLAKKLRSCGSGEVIIKQWDLEDSVIFEGIDIGTNFLRYNVKAKLDDTRYKKYVLRKLGSKGNVDENTGMIHYYPNIPSEERLLKQIVGISTYPLSKDN